jgi:hypothetical protein
VAAAAALQQFAQPGALAVHVGAQRPARQGAVADPVPPGDR